MIRHGVTNLALPPNKGQTFVIEKIFQHPKYVGTAYFDIAVLQISPVKFLRQLRPVCLPDPSKYEIDQYEEKTTTLIGWGSKEISGDPSPILKRTILTVYEYG